MEGKLFDRKWRILVRYEDEVALDVSDLHCLFRVQQNPNGQVWTAEINIYNLAPATEKVIILSKHSVIIEAGYEVQYGTIFEGQVVQVFRELENATDYKLTIIAMSGDEFLNQNFLNRNLAAGSKPRDVISLCASDSVKKVQLGNVSEELSEQQLPRGKVFFGEPKKYLRDISEGNDALFWVSGDTLTVKKTTDPIEGEAIVLTPSSGLIGTPQMTNEGIAIKSLLNPLIVPFSMVKIDNSLIRIQKLNLNPSGQLSQQQLSGNAVFDEDGEYQAYLVTHYGDTRGNDWYTELIGIGRNGKLPLPLENEQQTMK
ncbi:MAG: phage protein [bacterium]